VGEEGLARFEREVQVSSVLSHPNTIEIYDFGHTPDGTFYYAMEYVKGITLGSCVSSGGPIPEARVLHVMKQACASIAEAHDQGLMHRDLKPSNIMLCERGGTYDFVKVLDFGLVKELDKGQSVDLTDVASLTGTPLYMPPEAVQSPESLDVRGDVYQLGLCAYFLLAGRNVFEGDAPVDVIVQHVSATPTPPSEVLGHAVSPELEEIILRCLEKEPDKRFNHARALLEAFEACDLEARWGQREARAWWVEWLEQHPDSDDAAPPTSTLPSGYDIDLGERLQAP
jgi:serine/threonine protein kinase